MAKQISSITVQVGMRWWFKPAVVALLAAHRLTGWVPREAHVHLLAKYGTYCRVQS